MNSEGFKETEIGLIPKEWQEVNLGEFSQIITGYPFKSALFSQNGVRLVRGDNITRGNLRWGDKTKYWAEISPEIEKYLLKENDVLVSMDGSLVGKNYVKIKDSDLPLLLVQRVACIRAIDGIIQDFIYYLVSSERFREYIDMIKTGTTIPHISVKQIKGFIFALPTLNEQKEITKILTSIEEKIYLNQEMNRTLEAIGQALFRHWFVHYEFPNEEGQPYKSSGGEMVDSELGEIPAGWEVKELGKVIETTGGGTPSTKKTEYWENGEIQWFSPRDITANNQMFITNSDKKINDLGLKNSSARLFPPYSLMMTSRATVGELSINTTEACTNQGFITCVPNEFLSTFYLYFWIRMNKEYIISLASGSTFREINKSTFRNLKIVVPGLKSMKLYNKLIKPLFSQIMNNQAQNTELSQIRDVILPKLMSGKIRVKLEGVKN